MTVHELEKVIGEVVEKEEQVEEGSEIDSFKDKNSKIEDKEIAMEEQSELCKDRFKEE